MIYPPARLLRFKNRLDDAITLMMMTYKAIHFLALNALSKNYSPFNETKFQKALN